MRQLTFGIIASAAFLAASCDKSHESRAPEGPAPGAFNASGNEGTATALNYFTVRAGPIANAKITELSGTFQMLKVSAAQGIPSNGVGGACIVFSAADLGLTKIADLRCNLNKDCQDPGAAAYYCHNHSCWVRPKADLSGAATCNRPITMTATILNPVPPDPPAAGPIDATKLGIQPGARARVVACLNKGQPPYPPPGAGCRQIDSNERIEDFGPVATVHP